MHGNLNVKFVNAKQAKETYQYRNTKEKLYKTNAAKWYNKMCREKQLTPSWSCSQAVSKPVWHIPLLCEQWKTPDDGQRNCPKYVEFYSRNKFEKLVHLGGFIMRIYHDTQ
jgi:predicted DNA-binding ArsR family transcriptional regulator